MKSDEVFAQLGKMRKETYQKSVGKGIKREIFLSFIDNCKEAGYDIVLQPTRTDIAKALGVAEALRKSGWEGSILEIIKVMVDNWSILRYPQSKNLQVPDLGLIPIVYKECLQILLHQGVNEDLIVFKEVE